MTGEKSTEIGDAEATIRSEPESAALKIPGFELLKSLGKGGMGIVYLAHQKEGLDRKVAIKTILGNRDNDYFRRKFLEEGQRQAQLHHPNILPIFLAGEAKDCLYLVMHYARDGSLRDRLSEGPLDVAETVRIICHIAEALEHAHHELDEPVIHLDIKPDNILFDGKNPLLSDFGIARKITGPVSPGTVIAGDPRYWAPEQQTNQPSEKSDIYALGLTFFELLVGRRPNPDCKIVNSGSDRDAILKAMPAGAKEYGKVIANCLRGDPAQRPTALELFNKLKELSEPSPRRLSLGLLAAAAVFSVYMASSPTAQNRVQQGWQTLFPLATHEVSFEVSPGLAQLWVDGKEQTFRRATLTEGNHNVVSVADGFLGKHILINVDGELQSLEMTLSPRAVITDSEYLSFSKNYGVNDTEILARQWSDTTLANMVQIELMQKDNDPALAGFIDSLEWLARAGDSVAQTTLFYGAYEGLPIPGERQSYLPGLSAASAAGYPLATMLHALHVLQELLDSGQTFDNNPDAFSTVTALLRTAKNQGLPETATIFAKIINADISL